MIGLMKMAAALAEKRANMRGAITTKEGAVSTATREWVQVSPATAPASREYYAIIDRISRGETP